MQDKEKWNASHISVQYRGYLCTRNVRGKVKGNCRCENKRWISWWKTSSSNLIYFLQTVIWKKYFIRKDVNWEIWGLECRKVLSITAYVAGIVRAALLGKGSLNCMTQFWMEKEVKIKKRVTKTVTLSVSSKTRNLGGWCLLFRANDTSQVRQIIPLNNWNVNFKETEMPPKWGLHSFQHSSSDSNIEH